MCYKLSVMKHIASRINIIRNAGCTRPVKLLLAGATLALFAGATVSCGTVRGMGQDIQKAGSEIQKAAH